MRCIRTANKRTIQITWFLVNSTQNKNTKQAKRKVPSPDRQTMNDDHDKAPAIRPKRKRVRKEEESEGIDLCAK